MNETVLNRRVITCIISLNNIVKELIWNLYLSLRPSDMEEKYFLGTSAWEPMLTMQLQNKSGFETEQRERCLFSSQIESSIPTFRDRHLHLLVWNRFSLQMSA